MNLIVYYNKGNFMAGEHIIKFPLSQSVEEISNVFKTVADSRTGKSGPHLYIFIKSGKIETTTDRKLAISMAQVSQLVDTISKDLKSKNINKLEHKYLLNINNSFSVISESYINKNSGFFAAIRNLFFSTFSRNKLKIEEIKREFSKFLLVLPVLSDSKGLLDISEYKKQYNELIAKTNTLNDYIAKQTGVSINDPQFEETKREYARQHSNDLELKEALAASIRAEGDLKYLPAKFAKEHYDDFSIALINGIPDVKISPQPSSKEIPQKSDLNNNGLEVDEKDLIFSDEKASIDRDGANITLRCVTKATIDGVEYDFTKSREGKAYFHDGRLYSSREDARYHDHVLVSGGRQTPVVITLCDGSGHSRFARPAAIKTATAAHEAVAEKIGECKTTRDVHKLQMEALREAGNAIYHADSGTTTFIQAAVVGNVLTGVVVGDSKAYVLRPKEGGGWIAIDLLGNTKGTLDPRTAGGQLSSQGYCDFHQANLFAFNLMPGDVFYTCSDGIVDNLDPSTNNIAPNTLKKQADALNLQIASEKWEDENEDHIKLALKASTDKIEDIIQECKTGEEITVAMNKFVQENTKQKKINFMTNPDAKEEDASGKLDDAASAFFVYNP